MNRLLASFKYGFAGIAHAIRTQANLRIHLSISIAVVIAGLSLRISNTEWAIIVVTMMIVLSAELFNTSIENAMDRVSPEQHPLVKVAKDSAAGAVLITAIGAIVVGVLIFGPKLIALIAPR
jgi:diacylglycerol kinase